MRKAVVLDVEEEIKHCQEEEKVGLWLCSVGGASYLQCKTEQLQVFGCGMLRDAIGKYECDQFNMQSACVHFMTGD